jgi:hypothetical protein
MNSPAGSRDNEFSGRFGARPTQKCAWPRLAWVNYVNSKMYAARLAEDFPQNKY